MIGATSVRVACVVICVAGCGDEPAQQRAPVLAARDPGSAQAPPPPAPGMSVTAAGDASLPPQAASAAGTPTDGSAGTQADAPVQPAAQASVTYHADIRPLMEVRCLGCHVEGGSGPFPLDTWERVEPYGALIVDAVGSRRMPPWLADSSECRKLAFDQRLTDAQLALFDDWAAGGFQQGDPQAYVPIVEEPPPVLGEPTLVTVATRPYQLRAHYEEYVCLQMDVSFPEDTFVTAMDMVPDNPEYVHHAIVSSGTGRCSALGTVAENIYSYRPGSRTLAFEDGDALLIPAGSQLAVEFHYNTAFTERGASLPTDHTQFRMWTLPSGETPRRVITRYPFHDLSISIPVGATDATAGGTVAMTTASSPPGGRWAPGEIIGVTPHMHALGKSFRETLRRADGSELCLIDVPDWDWEWQLDYFFAPEDVVPIQSSDRLVQRCVYSNTPEDQLVVDGVRRAPQYTRFGQDSADEMCLGYIWFRYLWSDL